MKAKRGLLCVSALGVLGAVAVVFGWRWVERESEVGVVGSAPYDDRATAERIGSADSGGSMLPDAALAAAPDCLAASFEPAASDSQSIVRQFLGELGIADVRTLSGLLITDLAGVNPLGEKGVGRLTRELRGFDIPRLDLLLPPVIGEHGKREILGFSRQRPLEDALQAPTLDQFIAAAHDEPALMRRRWGHMGLALAARADSALGHALRVRRGEVLRRVHEIPAAAFGLHELAVTMAQGMDPTDFLALLDRSGVDPKATWLPPAFPQSVPKRYNLAALAAVHVRPQILRVLLERGIALPARPPSVLDELSLSLAITRPAPDVLGDVVGQLAAVGERPYLPSTAARLAAAAPGIAVPGVHPDAEKRRCRRPICAVMRRSWRRWSPAKRSKPKRPVRYAMIVGT